MLRARWGEMLVRCITILAVGAVVSAPVWGHHSDAAVDIDSAVAIEGTVTEYSWRNPHIYFTVETGGEGDEPVEWTVQMAGSITVVCFFWAMAWPRKRQKYVSNLNFFECSYLVL